MKLRSVTTLILLCSIASSVFADDKDAKVLKQLTDIQNQLKKIDQRVSKLEKGPAKKAEAAKAAVAAAGGIAAPAGKPKNPVAGKVWFFAMGDTRSSIDGVKNQIFAGTARNVEKMTDMVTAASKDPIGGEKHLGATIKLTSSKFSYTSLKDALASTTVGTNDVVFVYVACHGATDKNGQRAFQMPGQKGPLVLRSDVWKLAKSKGARQTILISDCCSSRINMAVEPQDVQRDVLPPQNTLALLLLYQIGDVDVNGSSGPPKGNYGIRGPNGENDPTGEFGWYYTDANNLGGLFTHSLIDACFDPMDASWNNLFNATQKRLNSRIKGLASARETRGPGGALLKFQRIEVIGAPSTVKISGQ